MHWLLQNAFHHDPKYRELIGNLERLGIEHTFCKVIPFTDDGIEFEGDVTIESLKDTPVFTYGSYTLAKIARKHFRPGAFISPNINIDVLLANYGDEMFNSDMTIAPIKDLDTDLPQFFIRPVEDTKSFCGGLMTLEDFHKWKAGILELSEGKGYSTITPDTMAVIASRKPIENEYRFFIVHGQIATCSQYRFGGRVTYIQDADPYVKDYVDKIINHWMPDHAFCLDIATVGGVPKVLEVNCINASGLYAIDTQKFVIAVESLSHGTDDEVDNSILAYARPRIH